MKEIVLSVDLMGGDNKITVPFAAIANFLQNSKTPVKFLGFGTNEAKKQIPSGIASKFEFIESESYIKSDDDPILAMRRGKNTSMFMAIKSVSEGVANASVSAGNTGALMAISKLCFKTLEGIERPAIATLVPTISKPTLLLDMGANVECEPRNLYEFAIMGCAFISSVFGIESPTVSILNIGTEENKGRSLERNSFTLFKEKFSPEVFKGFAEGNDIMKGVVNVIVTDGYCGNIALKTMEGAGKIIGSELKKHISSSIFGKIGYLFAKSTLQKFKEEFDPNNYNGALFLGLNGISVKSHGSANEKGFQNAIGVACRLAENKIIEKIKFNLVK